MIDEWFIITLNSIIERERERESTVLFVIPMALLFNPNYKIIFNLFT